MAAPIHESESWVRFISGDSGDAFRVSRTRYYGAGWNQGTLLVSREKHLRDP